MYIMAFDHRASFAKMIFGKEQLSAEETQTARHYKHVIYQGLLMAVSKGVPKTEAAVLVDEYSGDKVLVDAKGEGISIILTTEKSGQKEFMFEYGQDFGAHIEKYKPQFTKALVRYNPENDAEINRRSSEQLKILSDYSHERGYKFLIEPLVPATENQLNLAGGDKAKYDQELRPDLTVRMIKELQDAGVEPDIWKIEGLNLPEQYEKVVGQAKSGGREKVSIVILGRGESPEGVEKWLKAGKAVKGVIGFAIGRTIFADALAKLHKAETSEEEAIQKICENYLMFYNIFKG